jgi:hypothetical protein
MISCNANVKAAFRYTCVWVKQLPHDDPPRRKTRRPAGRLPEVDSGLSTWWGQLVGRTFLSAILTVGHSE